MANHPPRRVQFGPAIALLVVQAFGCTYLYVTLGKDQPHWPLGANILLILLCIAPMFAFAWAITEHGKRVELDEIDEAQRQDRSIGARPEQPLKEAMLWGGTGSIILSVLAFLVASGVPPGLRVLIVLAFPFIGGYIGFSLSPGNRAEQEYWQRIKEVQRRREETEEERYARERVDADWPKTQREWRQRVYDAMLWWSSRGEKLTSDSDYLLALVRDSRGGDLPESDPRAQRYQNRDDPCSNEERAQRVASWAVQNLADLIRQHVREDDRTVEGLTMILRHHHRRDIVLYEEASAYHLNRLVERLRDESPEHLAERLLDRHRSAALARENGLARIQEIAGSMRPEQRTQYIARATKALDSLLNAWLRNRPSPAA